eukprot:145100-Amphidinium_carterae.1
MRSCCLNTVPPGLGSWGFLASVNELRSPVPPAAKIQASPGVGYARHAIFVRFLTPPRTTQTLER